MLRDTNDDNQDFESSVGAWGHCNCAPKKSALFSKSLLLIIQTILESVIFQKIYKLLHSDCLGHVWEPIWAPFGVHLRGTWSSTWCFFGLWAVNECFSALKWSPGLMLGRPWRHRTKKLWFSLIGYGLRSKGTSYDCSIRILSLFWNSRAGM